MKILVPYWLAHESDNWIVNTVFVLLHSRKKIYNTVKNME